MTPDQYRREGAEAMRKAAEEACDDYPRISPEYDEWRRYDEQIAHSVQNIRAIDVDEVLAAASAWKGPGETPHRYSPDYMSQGDCRVCGHTREAHQPAPDPVARLVEAANQARMAFAGYVPAESAINKLDEALAAMETGHD